MCDKHPVSNMATTRSTTSCSKQEVHLPFWDVLCLSSLTETFIFYLNSSPVKSCIKKFSRGAGSAGGPLRIRPSSSPPSFKETGRHFTVSMKGIEVPPDVYKGPSARRRHSAADLRPGRGGRRAAAVRLAWRAAGPGWRRARAAV